jgi:hypothetical protein
VKRIHWWTYYKGGDGRRYRCCRLCATMQECHDRYSPALPMGWYTLVRWTRRGAAAANIRTPPKEE